MSEIDDLDSLFAAASEQRVQPSPALLARILEDAEREQPTAPTRQPAVAEVPSGWLAILFDWFGGGFSLAGMSMAAMTGLYLGVAQPAAVLALSDLVIGQATIDSLEVLPSSGELWAQE